ncbi:MAG: GerMN domain-containing protein [Deinococcota bacterium]|nr:GerMN domain-containing protein [Deinococcota bacterium]
MTYTALVVALLVLAVIAALLIWTLRSPANGTVYFVRSQQLDSRLEPVSRPLGVQDQEARLKNALDALIAGPNAEEKARGLSSAMPQETRVLDLDFAGGLVTVNLSAEFERGGGTTLMTARLNQLFYTLTEDPAVTRVSLDVEGWPVKVFSGQGLIIDNPWDRTYHETLPVW